MSVVRNELNAALLTAEMANQYPEKSEKPTIFYTYSSTVLNFLTNLDISLKEYERSRVRKI